MNRGGEQLRMELREELGRHDGDHRKYDFRYRAQPGRSVFVASFTPIVGAVVLLSVVGIGAVAMVRSPVGPLAAAGAVRELDCVDQ